jgi:sugar phosphate isomerase/epimerase
MPTLLETKTIADCAALCCELGLDFVELNMNLPQYQAEKIDVAEFAETAKQSGIFYTIHLDENLNPCDFNERVAEAYTAAVLRTIELAARLSVPVLNMHLSAGVYFRTRRFFCSTSMRMFII